MTDDGRVAVLIDCDNMSHRWVRAILAEAAKHGTLGIKRGYGDWTDSHLDGWRDKLPEYAIQPIQQFAYTVGKNSTDFSLVIDAMDLLYAGTVDTFCLVTSDSDFTRIAMRLRESGKQVHGIGARKTPRAFQSACDQFTYVEVLVGEGVEAAAAEPSEAPASTTGAVKATARKAVKKATPAKKAAAPSKNDQVRQLTELLLPAVEANAKDDGWASLSAVGSYVVKTNPTFDSRNFGYAKLSTLVADLPALEVQELASRTDGLSVLYVREAGARSARRT
ncbi:MAG TPA: NYN domain-containing protein [Nocardioides sp.]|uniref:NYN domain-containing protein n=1 Tax=Nocardioides sp. TaxID=35761 RepID=UPI002E36A8DD|nr:NYN domain-containing protein [Nocardioides sp.]HEX3930160.1 NYN domain-containing protein [Nocardioides sp.]